MTRTFIITGTDTGIGKTVVSAGLAGLLSGAYWKPVQSGLDGETDSQAVARLAQLPPERILPEAWRLSKPLSPHRAAELDGVTIDPDRLVPPEVERPLIVEGAGGLMVPLTRKTLFVDLFARWQAPVVLCARTALGTINHTLLSIEALRRRDIPVLGVAFIGEAMPDTECTIAGMGEVRVLGRLPLLDPLTPMTLQWAMNAYFDKAAFDEART
ncbi:dethiobiotin synthase [Mesorhizobium sp.]|uniref:dethiobiotin synthase n=1 Tax=Mesorhizobium sp. TaxID=1871066 RepID=UPI000FE45D16|nr:dethiobiotin synthase [Mesorhizobium sp.]RWJ43138.1 MAG: ATP-dependent dethiobiotin synthetase BioD [Mesorhizobium sp.]